MDTRGTHRSANKPAAPPRTIPWRRSRDAAYSAGDGFRVIPEDSSPGIRTFSACGPARWKTATFFALCRPPTISSIIKFRDHYGSSKPRAPSGETGVGASRTMIERTEATFGIKPQMACGQRPQPSWGRPISKDNIIQRTEGYAVHLSHRRITVADDPGTFSREEFIFDKDRNIYITLRTKR